MADKKSFVMYKSWNPMLENLPYEKLGELMYYILLYQDGEVDAEPTDPMVAAMFAMIKATMEQDADKYAETCAKRAESGKMGGRPKKQEVIEDNQNKANGFSEKQEETKKADNESESDKDNDKDNESDKDSSTKKKKNKKEKAPAVDYEGMLECSSLSSGLIDKIMEWVQYKQAKKKPYTELGFKSFITQVEKYEREYGTENVIDVVTRTMSNEYIGIVWDWLKNMKKPTPAGKVDWDNI